MRTSLLRRFLGLAFVLVVAVGVSGCSTRVIKNETLWYEVTVPKEWGIKGDLIAGDQGDLIKITRLPDDGEIENLVKSTRNSVQIEMTGFVTESEDWLSVRGHKTWRMVGTFRPKKNGPEVTLIKVIVDAGKYKYIMDIRTPSEQYKERQKLFEKMVQSFSFDIPKY
ncbi:MAG: hypothetical protein H6728_11245 [Myxococcales bacterium]|nr:hypothetical protein [Myxococcales bacterium]MCB9643637.1 hypothetical protein [Myxococcales bacterium]